MATTIYGQGGFPLADRPPGRLGPAHPRGNWWCFENLANQDVRVLRPFAVACGRRFEKARRKGAGDVECRPPERRGGQRRSAEGPRKSGRRGEGGQSRVR